MLLAYGLFIFELSGDDPSMSVEWEMEYVDTR